MWRRNVRFVGLEAPKMIKSDKLYDLRIFEHRGIKRVSVWDVDSVIKVVRCMEYKPEEWETVLEVKLRLAITGEDIDDIMAGALEGGISYWCSRVEVDGKYLGDYASEQISRGGQLILCEICGTKHLLTRGKLVDGIVKYLQNPHPYNILNCWRETFMKIDTGKCDEMVCDMIIQYAIFGEVVYG